MMKSKFRVLLIVLVSSLSLSSGGVPPKAERGVIDMRNVEFSDQLLIKLNGEWEFYWKKMLHPHDFASGNPVPDLYGNVPSYWTDYKSGSFRTEKEGYATYRLTVLLPPGFRRPLGFDVPVFDSSYDLYINDQYYASNGIPGKTKEETNPEYRTDFFRIIPATDTLSIVINVSNFSHRRGGFWLPLKIGTFTAINRHLANSWAAEWATISLLLGFSLFFMFLFLIYPKEKVMGYFGMATIGLALRPLFTSHFLVNSLAKIEWTWIVRFEYLGLYIVIVGWLWFALIQYPSKVFRYVARFISVFFTIAFILTLFLPVRLFSYATMAVYPTMVFLMFYALVQSFRGIMKKNRLDIVYFSAFLLLVAGGIHDIRVSMGKSESTGYLLTYIVVIFIFIQAALLLYKWVKSYYEMDRLRNELEFLNRNLELLVDERTRELKKRTTEIENQTSRIALQNKQLSDTIQLKNKIFSVIAHDLRSPVVNILYMLNLLKEKEYKEKYDTFANSSIQYAQKVISLLENMLVWGRGQEDKIKYSPAKRNLADIVLTNLSIFKETSDKKDISVNFTQVGNSNAYVDKDLIDIIIRNLLSNAVKYTPRGGRISILLKDKSNDGEGILLKICDNGIGIPVTKQKYLFTSTEMTSTPGTENEKGTGLGLKLCSELVEINKGTICVESKEGEGTCFSINLPEGQP